MHLRSHPAPRRRPIHHQTRFPAVMIESLEARRMLSTTLYVDASSSGPVQDGSSWADAYADLQQALAAANVGDQIHIAGGTYKPTTGADRTATFQLKSGVALYGGYAGLGAADPDARNVAAHPSVLSGDIGTIGDNTDNSYHVVTGSSTDATAILDGFTITGGMADATAPSPGQSVGGGMLNISGSPTINDCIFRANAATGQFSGGGAMFNFTSSSPMITRCTFTQNTASVNNPVTGSSSYGGAVAINNSSPTLINCVFSDNHDDDQSGSSIIPGRGGAIATIAGLGTSAPVLTGCLFTGNTAGTGGGIYSSHSSCALSGCTFTSNNAALGGGGMYVESPRGKDLILNNCTFTANTTGGNGGGVYNYFSTSSSAAISNCIFTANTAGGSGGGMFNLTAHPALSNCTFTGNTAHSGGGFQSQGPFGATLTGCTFNHNAALPSNSNPGIGGAVEDATGSKMTNCTFTANTANAGGAVYAGGAPTLTNCVFVGNSATDLAGPPPIVFAGSGGAVFVSSSPSSPAAPAFVNCSFTQNAASFGGALFMQTADASPVINNCILWGDTATDGEISVNASTPVVSHSDVQGGFAGAGNIDADPLFVRAPSSGADAVWGTADDDYGDLRLGLRSPCIDAGDNTAVPAGITTDLAGNPRFVDFPGVNDPGAIVDLGAYERPAVSVVGRWLFYNDSVYDGGNAAASAADDNAIDPTRIALLPGQTATSASCSGYSRGINGIMIDVAGLPAAVVPTIADFSFAVGRGGAWAAAPIPAISVRRGAGAQGSDRITLTWDDGAIVNQWLRVTVNATAATGLTAPDVFYFGNLVGDTGNDTGATALVSAADLAATRVAPGTPITVSTAADINRDGVVGPSDAAIIRANLTHSLAMLTAPAVLPPAPLSLTRAGSPLVSMEVGVPPTTAHPAGELWPPKHRRWTSRTGRTLFASDRLISFSA